MTSSRSKIRQSLYLCPDLNQYLSLYFTLPRLRDCLILSSDLAVYRSVQALQRKFGPEALIGSSISSIRDQGGHGGVSGGTIETFLSFFDSYPPSKRADALDPFIISPCKLSFGVQVAGV